MTIRDFPPEILEWIGKELEPQSPTLPPAKAK